MFFGDTGYNPDKPRGLFRSLYWTFADRNEDRTSRDLSLQIDWAERIERFIGSFLSNCRRHQSRAAPW